MQSQSSRRDDSSADELKKDEQMGRFQQFTQQMLKAWLPIPSLTKTTILFFSMSLIFLSIGIPMIILTNNIIQVTVNYDDVCLSSATNCPVTFNIPQTMQSPVFVYYQLHSYYQNHRLYTSSISYKQFEGDTISESDADSACQPIVKNSDLYVTTSITGMALDPNGIANPCGMVPFSIFNDTFAITYPNGTNVSTMTTNGIAWPSDQLRYSYSDPSQMWLNVTDPRVMNWIRIATLPNFRKLWARINNDLPAGNYTLLVNSSFILTGFNANKYFVLSTSNFFGSRNEFLSIIYLIMGSLCFVVGVGFLIKKCRKNAKISHRE